MTFTIPDDLASRLVKQDRSRYVARALAGKFRQQKDQFIRACELANQDPEFLAIEREFAHIPDDIAEPWTNTPAR